MTARTPPPTKLVAFCRNHMASHKAPRTVVFSPLPKTSTRKLQKHMLRDREQEL